MHITNESLERVNTSRITGDVLARAFEELERATADTNAIGAAMTLDFQSLEDKVKPGDMIPTITLALRPATQQ